MENMKKIAVILLLVIANIGGVYAQSATHGVQVTINQVAMIAIVRTGGGSLNLQGVDALLFRDPLTPGLSIRNPNNNSTLWLNYTSIKTGAPRSIKVNSNINPNGGISFTVLTIGQVGGTGEVGNAFNNVSITTNPESLIEGIGSGYTGVGASNGVNLRYGAALGGPGSFNQLMAGTQSFNVTYTLSDD